MNKNPTNCAVELAMAAPLTPSSGKPNLPQISI